MSIIVDRIKKELADINLGGMQTGQRKIALSASDAQRAVAEIEQLERENKELKEAMIDVITEFTSEIRYNYVGLLDVDGIEDFAAKFVTTMFKKIKG